MKPILRAENITQKFGGHRNSGAVELYKTNGRHNRAQWCRENHPFNIITGITPTSGKYFAMRILLALNHMKYEKGLHLSKYRLFKHDGN